MNVEFNCLWNKGLGINITRALGLSDLGIAFA